MIPNCSFPVLNAKINLALTHVVVSWKQGEYTLVSAPFLSLTLFKSETTNLEEIQVETIKGKQSGVPGAHLELWEAGGITSEVRMPHGISHLLPPWCPGRWWGAEQECPAGDIWGQPLPYVISRVYVSGQKEKKHLRGTGSGGGVQ